MGRRERTRERLQECALDLFERLGYERTTAAQIAAAAGVTEMTFFRHFPAKHQVLLEDPFDPVMAAAVAGQPRALGPLVRTVRGISLAVAQLPRTEHELVRRRVRIIAGSPALRGDMRSSTAETEEHIVEQLIADGADPLRAAVAAAAVLAGLTSALLAWAEQDRLTLIEAIITALDVLEAADG